MRARVPSRRLSRSRAGRLPYAFVGVVVLASMLILTIYAELAVNFTNNNTSYNVPEEIQSAFILAQEQISAAAYQDLMRAEAALLVAQANPDLDLLNYSVGQLFSGPGGSLQTLNLTTPLGLVDGSVTIHALAWGINVTWDEGQVYDGLSSVSLRSDSNDPNLALAAIPDASHLYNYGRTEVPAYPMVVGWVSLTGYDYSTGITAQQTVTFTETLQSEIGLLQMSADEFSAASSGPTGDFDQLVQYLTTTLGELRALSAYGTPGYLGAQMASGLDGASCVGNASRATWGVLCDQDIEDAVSLAEILMSLQYFHDYDPAAAYAFLSSLPSGAYQSLLQTYVTSGQVDGAALYLLLLNSQGGWSDGWISSGEGLAAEVNSFADRYAYDLLNETFGNQTVDPTETNPVVGWGMIQNTPHAMNLENVSALLYRWLGAFQNWLGITVTSLPASDVTAVIPAEVGTSGTCTYTILPAGTIQVSTNPVPNIADLIMGTSYPTDSQGLTELPSLLYNVWENVSLDTADIGGDYWSEVVVGNTEQAGYYFTDESLLHEYDQSGGIGVGGAGTSLTPYLDAIDAILNTTTASMEYKPDPTPAPNGPDYSETDTIHTGYLNYLAQNASHHGNNYTLVQAGLPDLTTAAGITQALDSPSYSLLTNGSNSILSGPYAWAAQQFGTQLNNASWLNDTWLNGAWHANLLPANASGPGGGSESQYNSYAFSDIAFLTAREWYQLVYGLWFGSAGDIPTTIPAWDAGKISYTWMDGANYHVVSPGVRHAPPPAYQEPDFAINVMNETYISALDYMGWDLPSNTECGRPFGTCAYTANGLKTAFATGPAACQTAAYDNALATYYNEEGTGPADTDNTWLNVRTAVLQAIDGTPGNPGIGQIHDAALAHSWFTVRNETDEGYFASWNFTNWSLQTIAGPVLNDTRMLMEQGGWLEQGLNSTRTAIWQGANESTTITKPYVENQVAYSLWQGNYTAEQADQQLFNESLRPYSAGMNVTGGPTGLDLAITRPAETIHLVDPQDDVSNMGIAPYTTTWEVSVTGSLSLHLVTERPVLSEGGYLYPTDVNFTIPMDVNVPITIYTPWEMSSAYDDQHAPLPGDPAEVQTRQLLGLEFHDYHTQIVGTVTSARSYAYLPGLYVSPTLDQFFSQTASIGKVVASDGIATADLLSALPDRGVGGSASLVQNLTTLENTTNADLGAPNAVGYLAQVSASAAQLNYDLTQPYLHGGPFNDQTFAMPGFFGSAATLDVAPATGPLTGPTLDVYGAASLPVACQAAPSAATCFGDPYEYDLTFNDADARIGASLYLDNDFNAPGPFTQGFRADWTPTGGPAGLPWTSTGGFTLQGFWEDFVTPYELDLGGGAAVAPSTQEVVSHVAGHLDVPSWGPLSAYSAAVSVEAIGPNLPAAASTAYQDAVAGYLPPSAAFSGYVAEQQYAAGDLFDEQGGPAVGGVTSFGYSTDLRLSTVAGAARDENFSLSLNDLTTPGGIFGGQPAALDAFLQWYVENHQQIAYGLGVASADPTTLASAEPFLVSDIFRNVTLDSGAFGAPSTFAYASANLAFSESDLGGTGGALLDSPTLELGGGAPGSFEMTGELVAT